MRKSRSLRVERKRKKEREKRRENQQLVTINYERQREKTDKPVNRPIQASRENMGTGYFLFRFESFGRFSFVNLTLTH